MAQNTMFMKNVEEPTTPQPPAAEQKQPTYPQFNSAADIDARFMQMMERDAERDRAEQQRRLQRQQFAQSMGDLGNVLIDTIKMSGGALVTPRDVSARYQQMDAQSQKIYDTYRARMDLLRKYQLEREKENRAAELAREKMMYDAAMKQAELKQNWDIAQAKMDSNERIAGIRKDATIGAASIRGGAQKAREDKDYYYEVFNGSEIPIPKNRYYSRMAALYAYIDNNGLFPETADADDGLKAMALRLSSNPSNMPEANRNRVVGAVQNALFYIKANHPEHIPAINAILTGGNTGGGAVQTQTAGSGNNGGGRLTKSQTNTRTETR